MARNLAASGYESTLGSIYAPPQISAKVVKQYHECALTPQLAKSDFLTDGELFCGSKVVFGVERDLDFFGQDTDNNEHPETFSGPGVDNDSLMICQSQKFEIKISNIDKRRMCDNFSSWEANLRNQIDKGIKRLVDAYSIPKIIASAHPDNVGTHAGKLTHSYNLGDQGANALPGNSEAGFEEMILSLQDVAAEAGMVCGEGELAGVGPNADPVVLIPRQLRRWALRLMKGLDTCCSDQNVMRTGMIGTLFGMRIFVTNHLYGVNYGAAGNLAPVVLVDPNQVLHAFDVITNKWWEDKWEDYLVGEFIWDTHVINKYGVAVAISQV